MHRNAHAFSNSDLFQSFDVSKIKFKESDITHKKLQVAYKYSSKLALVCKIFYALIELIIKDMVKTGSSFSLPVKAFSMFTWRKLQGDKFKKAYVSGKFEGLDFLESNFTIFQPVMKFEYRNKHYERQIIPGKGLKDEIIQKTNDGFKYC